MKKTDSSFVAAILACLSFVIAVSAGAEESRPVLSAEETEGLYLIRKEISTEPEAKRERLSVTQFVPRVVPRIKVPVLPEEEQPPVIHLEEPATEVEAPAVTISGHVEDDSGVALVEVNGEMIAFDTDGNFSGEVELNPGLNEIRILATDLNLNEAEQTVEIRLIASALPPG